MSGVMRVEVEIGEVTPAGQLEPRQFRVCGTGEVEGAYRTFTGSQIVGWLVSELPERTYRVTVELTEDEIRARAKWTVDLERFAEDGTTNKFTQACKDKVGELDG